MHTSCNSVLKIFLFFLYETDLLSGLVKTVFHFKELAALNHCVKCPSVVKWALCAVLLFKETDVYFANDEDECKSGCKHSVLCTAGWFACPRLTKGFLW